jgi:hypothetical protein
VTTHLQKAAVQPPKLIRLLTLPERKGVAKKETKNKKHLKDLPAEGGSAAAQVARTALSPAMATAARDERSLTKGSKRGLKPSSASSIVDFFVVVVVVVVVVIFVVVIVVDDDGGGGGSSASVVNRTSSATGTATHTEMSEMR